jgi:RNA polymerase sigma-70 factor (ECF subfamily)
MLEDKLLVWKFRHGSKDALGLIYQKYKDDLLALAVALSNDRAVAEDVLHDSFVSFARVVHKLRIRTSLKSYLMSCVANRVRNLGRSKKYQAVELNEASFVSVDTDGPVDAAMTAEQSQRIGSAISELPYEQQEVIMLRLQAGMKFKVIAESLGVSINTAQARYRYGLQKLQSTLNGEMER